MLGVSFSVFLLLVVFIGHISRLYSYAGHYMYAEDGDGVFGDHALLMSPILTVPSGFQENCYISFYYSMNGNSVGKRQKFLSRVFVDTSLVLLLMLICTILVTVFLSILDVCLHEFLGTSMNFYLVFWTVFPVDLMFEDGCVCTWLMLQVVWQSMQEMLSIHSSQPQHGLALARNAQVVIGVMQRLAWTMECQEHFRWVLLRKMSVNFFIVIGLSSAWSMRGVNRQKQTKGKNRGDVLMRWSRHHKNNQASWEMGKIERGRAARTTNFQEEDNNAGLSAAYMRHGTARRLKGWILLALC